MTVWLLEYDNDEGILGVFAEWWAAAEHVRQMGADWTAADPVLLGHFPDALIWHWDGESLSAVAWIDALGERVAYITPHEVRMPGDTVSAHG